MFLMIAGSLIAVWVLYMGWKFYGTIDWNEPAETGPDFHAMRKREAELMHIQDVLEEAHKEGKLAASAVEEVNRYCDAEIKSFRETKTAWQNRPKSDPASRA